MKTQINLTKFISEQMAVTRSFLATNGFDEVLSPQVENAVGHPFLPAFEVKFFDRMYSLSQASRVHLLTAMANTEKAYTLLASFRAQKPRQSNRLFECRYLQAMFKGDLANAIDYSSLLLQLASERLRDKESNMFIGQSLAEERAHVSVPLPRVTYEEAVQLIGAQPNEPLDLPQQISLVERAGNRPLVILSFPNHLKPNIPDVRISKERLKYFEILAPKVGSIFAGSELETNKAALRQQLMTSPFYKALVRTSGQKEDVDQAFIDYIGVANRLDRDSSYSSFAFSVERLTQFLVGADEIEEATLFPVTETLAPSVPTAT